MKSLRIGDSANDVSDASQMVIRLRNVGHTGSLSESRVGYAFICFIKQNVATYTTWMGPKEDIKKTKNGGISKDKYCK